MSSAQGGGGNQGSGCLLLLAGAVVLAVVGFVLEHIEVFLTLGAVIAVGALVVHVVRSRARAAREAPPEERSAARGGAESRAARQARWAGKHDMRTAWFQWQLGPLPAPAADTGPRAITSALAVIPKSDWSVERLREHGRGLWRLLPSAGGHHLQHDVEARLDRVAAMISDLNDETFDTRSGQVDDQYLYHQDREVREAYLEGGALAVEAIMDTISAARVQARHETELKAGADSLAEQRNAALRAMRETQRSTQARDAQAEWEARARELGL